MTGDDIATVEELKKMMTTVVTHQENLMHRTTRIEQSIEMINQALTKLLLLEERQINEKEARQRMGREIDKINELVGTLYDKFAVLDKSTAITSTKVGIIGAVSGIVGSAIVGAIFKAVTG